MPLSQESHLSTGQLRIKGSNTGAIWFHLYLCLPSFQIGARFNLYPCYPIFLSTYRDKPSFTQISSFPFVYIN